MDDEVNSLIKQLKTSNSISKKIIKDQTPPGLDKADLEQFVLDNSAKLIQNSMEMIESMKDYVAAAPNPDDVGAFAELFKASTHAMEVLNKILIQNKRGDTTKEVKQMDIDSKNRLAHAEHSTQLLLTRDTVVQKLIDDAEIIEIPAEEPTPLE